MAQADDIWDEAAREELQYYNAIDDCLAQCAITFGGGIAPYREYTLPELLRWTHRAIISNQSSEAG